MTFEVAGPGIGQLRAKDVRAILGTATATTRHLDVMVLGPPGQPPWAGRVYLVDKPSGRGRHRVLACPACLQPRGLLLVGDGGRLACRFCLRCRTRRQTERTTAAWRRFGGMHEDQLLRLLRCPGASAPKLALAQRVLEELVHGDIDGVAALEGRVDGADSVAAASR